MKLQLKSKKGFTLIELLVVIAILAILLVIVLVAVNPARQTRDARNTQRRADVLTILNSVNQYFIENGAYPSGTPTQGSTRTIDATGGAGSTGTGFCSALVPDFVAALPADPTTGSYSTCSSFGTGYTIERLAGDRVTIAAPSTEGGIATVSATR